jgi:hypothetical protein
MRFKDHGSPDVLATLHFFPALDSAPFASLAHQTNKGSMGLHRAGETAR